jgi:hypothetical protein
VQAVVPVLPRGMVPTAIDADDGCCCDHADEGCPVIMLTKVVLSSVVVSMWYNLRMVPLALGC